MLLSSYFFHNIPSFILHYNNNNLPHQWLISLASLMYFSLCSTLTFLAAATTYTFITTSLETSKPVSLTSIITPSCARFSQYDATSLLCLFTTTTLIHLCFCLAPFSYVLSIQNPSLEFFDNTILYLILFLVMLLIVTVFMRYVATIVKSTAGFVQNACINSQSECCCKVKFTRKKFFGLSVSFGFMFLQLLINGAFTVMVVVQPSDHSVLLRVSAGILLLVSLILLNWVPMLVISVVDYSFKNKLIMINSV